MPDPIQNWKTIATAVHEALRQIDPLLTRENVPISARIRRAFEILQVTILDIPDYKVFFHSAAYGAFLVIIEDWYRDLYGNAVDNDKNDVFLSMLLVHGTPFAMRVPINFATSTDEPNIFWIGFPASVQAEEDPLNWIESEVGLGGLSHEELDVLRTSALETANLVRSISFDVRSLEYDEEDVTIAKLAGLVRADLQNSARNLCDRSEGGLSLAAWNASQATEKALKLLIRRKGQTPRHIHNLSQLAGRAEHLGAEGIDREKLALIPSGKDATDTRYGDGGNTALSEAANAYGAALSVISKIVFEAKPNSEFNVREGRIKIQRPPWFDFDTDKFSKQLRC